jgi:hypothetical protein
MRLNNAAKVISLSCDIMVSFKTPISMEGIGPHLRSSSFAKKKATGEILHTPHCNKGHAENAARF